MIVQLGVEDAARVKNYFEQIQYTQSGLKNRFGVAHPPNQLEHDTLVLRTHGKEAIQVAVRVFLMGAGLDLKGFQEVFPDWFCQFCLENRWVEVQDTVVRPNVVVVPRQDALFVSDALHRVAGSDASDFTLPASTRAADLLTQFMFTDPVKSVLDLCTGCGVHGILASEFAEQVTVSDVSPGALNFAKTNASLNQRNNVSFIESDLFQNLSGQTFDLIISNPPFVIGPKQDFVYRDNPLELDLFCKALVKEAPQHLNEGGYLQMLCEWVEVEGQTWEERLSEWVDGLGCDVWIARSQTRDPQSYIQSRLGDLVGPKTNFHNQLKDWSDYFGQNKVKGIHPGLMILRKREANDNWTHVHQLQGEPLGPTTETLKRYIQACDQAAALRNDNDLLESKLYLAEELELEQKFRRNQHQWQPRVALLNLQTAMPVQGEVDLAILALLNLFNGDKTTQAVINEFASASGADEAELKPKVLPVLRLLLERGFLVHA